jgi:flagellar basal-body rod protein FlgG
VLYRFANPQNLSRIEHDLYVPTERSGPPIECRPGEDGVGKMLQGFLEASNVEIAREQLRLNFLNEWRQALLR